MKYVVEKMLFALLIGCFLAHMIKAKPTQTDLMNESKTNEGNSSDADEIVLEKISEDEEQSIPTRRKRSSRRNAIMKACCPYCKLHSCYVLRPGSFQFYICYICHKDRFCSVSSYFGRTTSC